MKPSSINTIKVDGFHFVQHRRSSKHIKARKCSGGVGMLVNNEILQGFKFSVSDMSFEGSQIYRLYIYCDILLSFPQKILSGVMIQTNVFTFNK